ncbi:MAG: P-loop NTPase fold protein [Bacteroidota bacterium]
MKTIKNDKIPSLTDDLLNRKSIANEVAKGLTSYLKKNKDGFTISITGEWGSGKSTLLSFIKQILEEDNNEQLQIIEFNPWMFYKDESIKTAFLNELAVSLKDFETKTVNIASKINDLVKAFGWIKYLNSTLGNIQDALEKTSEHFAGKYNVHDIKNEIDAILRKSKKKILILIDDLDRLLPDQISEVLQTISLVANFSNVIYLLAFDRQIVIEALNRTYTGKGQDYLEKIIQVDYELPVIQDSRLEELFNLGVQGLERTYKIKFNQPVIKLLWNYHGLKGYFTSIRDFKKFFNALSFRLPSIAEDIYPADFLAIEAIRIFDYDSYLLFYKYYKTNSRKRELPNAGLTEEQFKEISSTASEIIKTLSNKTFAYQIFTDKNAKRLLDPAYFERYFSLLRSGNDIAEKDINDLVNRPTVRFAILKEVLQFNRIEDLIGRLGDNSFQRYYPEYGFDLITDLISFFNSNSDVFQKFSDRTSNMLINLICGHKKSKEYIRLFFNSFGEQRKHPSAVHYYFFHYIRLFRRGNEVFRPDYRIFDNYYKKNYDEIEEQYLPIFQQGSFSVLDYNHTAKCPFIKYLYQINYAELLPTLYGPFLEKLLQDREYLMYVVNGFFITDEDGLEVRRYNWTYKDILFPENSFIKLQELVKELQPGSLSSRDKSIRKHFLALDLSDYPTIKYPVQTAINE